MRRFTAIAALLLVLTLFAACTTNDEGASTAAPAAQPSQSAIAGTQATHATEVPKLEDYRPDYSEFVENILANDMSSVYIVDLNSDGAPEVFSGGNLGSGAEKMMSYSVDGGVTVADFMFHSSIGIQTYFDTEKGIVVVRDDGHNEGTANYHYAAKYVVGDYGIEQLAEISPEDSGESSEAILQKFNEEYNKLIEGLELTDYEDVCIRNDRESYISEKLGFTAE